MSIARRWLVYSLLGVIAAGSILCIATDTERWPFSRYAMYSQPLQADTLDQLRIFGVTSDGTEIPFVQRQRVAPFDRLSLRLAVTDLFDDGGITQLDEALRDCLKRYESRRRAGEHAGPFLGAIRVYRTHWTVDPHVRNRDAPDARELVREVRDP
jgi:hypothetical protein